MCALKVDLRSFLGLGAKDRGTPCPLIFLSHGSATPDSSELIEQDRGFEYHWRCKELSLFQLCFADDLLLFCKAEAPSRVDERIKGWEYLSFADRVQLIQSVLMALNAYWAMAFILPKGIIRKVEKLLRSFLWKGQSRGGYAKVAWSQVCRPKEEGGPGIRNVMALNKALMSRHLWRLITQDRTSIWVKWVITVRLRTHSI
ncbi:UNVERIFIED_CONTAM: hypothetical protein Sradi_6926300 [Sesamum radiatum]|uniref:Uncharacterized protein n=1 Tax=Sesamum radiatum TaxID=300843 RepID=A0AAW2JGN3_SESRA